MTKNKKIRIAHVVHSTALGGIQNLVLDMASREELSHF